MYYFLLLLDLSINTTTAIVIQNDIKSTMLHAILDVAMVVTYVFVGLFVANYILDMSCGCRAI